MHWTVIAADWTDNAFGLARAAFWFALMLLLVAGAAAGVSAIFKAPVTGLVFALEVPFQQDLARRMLLPAAMSSAASYVVFAAIAGTEPILPVAGQPPFNLVDLGGAAVIGLAAGVLARVFVALVRCAKRLSSAGHPALRVVLAGAVLAGTVLGAEALGGVGEEAGELVECDTQRRPAHETRRGVARPTHFRI